MSHAFKDAEGREWIVRVTVATIKRIRDTIGLDILDGENSIALLSSDPVTLCDVLYLSCKDDADNRNVSDEEFGRALWGDALDAATNAFLEALADFFRNPRQRKEEAGQRGNGSTDSGRGELLWREIYRSAGIVGVDPGPYTLREILWMRDGREMTEWNRTAWVCALIANVNRDPKKSKAFQPIDFHPMRKDIEKDQPKQRVGIEALRAFLPKGK